MKLLFTLLLLCTTALTSHADETQTTTTDVKRTLEKPSEIDKKQRSWIQYSYEINTGW